MISAWWLIAIIPVSAMVGYVICGSITFKSEQEKCFNCRYNKEKSE